MTTAAATIMDGVAKGSRHFGDKLRRLIDRDWRSQAHFADTLKIKRQKLYNYLAGSIPPPDLLLKIARTAGTSVEWLLDDEQVWPPPKGDEADPVRSATDGALLVELATRYRRGAVDAHEMLSNLEQKPREFLKWAITAWQIRFDAPLEEDHKQHFSAYEYTERLIRSIAECPADLSRFCAAHHDILPGADLPPEELTQRALTDRYQRFLDANAGYDAMRAYPVVRKKWQENPDDRAHLEKVQMRTLAYLVTLPEVAKDAKYDDIRKRLRGMKLLDKRNKPKPVYRFFISEPVPN